MITLSAAMATALGLTITRPGYLVRLAFPAVNDLPAQTIRLSTMGDISWNGQTWSGWDVKVAGVGQDGSGSASGSLAIGNTDNTYSAMVFNYGAADLPVDIWAFYAGATASGDPLQVFSGVTDGATPDPSKVTFPLVAQANKTLYAPRVFVNEANGFHFLQPAGTKIVVNGETYILDRA